MSQKILLVEDNPADADLLAEILTETDSQQWLLTHAQRLKDALKYLSGRRFDVVLLDLSLPDSQGLDTVTQLKSQAPDIPIVVLTGNDDKQLALRALAIGAQDYLVKGQITTLLLERAIRYAIERGQILKQLQESERRFRGIFEQTFQSMRLLTPEGIILEANQTSLDFAGLKKEECVGKPVWEIKCWNYSQETQEWLKNAIAAAAEGKFVRQEVQVRGVGDVMVWIDYSLKPLKDERGKVVMLIAEGRDISDRKQAEEEIRNALTKEKELNELKTRFISMTSHEFRNPLAAIMLSAKLLENYSHKLSDEKKITHFNCIQSSVKHLTQLLDDVLVIGKAEVGKLEFQPSPLNLVEFCHSFVEEMQLTAGKEYIIAFTVCGENQDSSLSTQHSALSTQHSALATQHSALSTLHSPLSTLCCIDEKLLRQILTNLLSNAIKYSPQGGTVDFELAIGDKQAIFQVKDRGIGIPPQDMPRLFESFHRAKNVGNIAGTGLGLTIVKRAVDLHGGEIAVTSEVGRGTTFTVTLPLNSSFN